MKNDKRNLLLGFMIGILFVGGTFSFAYFLMDIIGTGSNISNLSSGTLELNINDETVNINDLAPINDIDYENYAYKKEFEIENSGTLNGCSSLYLDITTISENLKSKYFKYKLVSDTDTYTGDFTEVENNRLLLEKFGIVNSKKTKKYTLYIWLSHDENIDQNTLLGTTMKGKLSIESKDCNILDYDYETVALYVNNTRVEELEETKNYKLESYICANGETVTFDNDKREIAIKPIKRQTKCSLYFKRIYMPTEYIKNGSVLIYDAEYNTASGHNDAVTTLYDWSGNSNTGTLEGPTWGSNYLSFDGVNDWVSIGQHNYNRITMEVVFSIDNSKNAEQNILGNFESGGYGLYILNGKLISSIVISKEYKEITTTPLELNKIYSASSAYNGTVLNLYTNNELTGTLNVSGNITSPNNSTILVLGGDPTGSVIYSGLFSGKIYSVRLYNRALTTEEIKHNYDIDKTRFGL